MQSDLGKLVLRLALGILVLLHGIAKVINGPGNVLNLVEKAGLPAELGYLVYVGEVLAPLMVIIGIWTRLGAVIIAINMVVAVWLVHMGDLFSLTKNGGWALELQAMYLFTAIAVALLGAGRLSIAGSGSRFN